MSPERFTTMALPFRLPLLKDKKAGHPGLSRSLGPKPRDASLPFPICKVDSGRGPSLGGNGEAAAS